MSSFIVRKLDLIKQKTRTIINALAQNDSWSETPIRPWRRYFARMLDMVINSFFAVAIIFLIFSAIAFTCSFFLPEQTKAFFSDENSKTFEMFLNSLPGIVIDTVITAFIAALLTAIIFGITGSTIGKWIFGIKIRDADNNKLNMKTTFKREIDIYIGGLALCIPIVSFFALLAAHSRLTKKGKTCWDEDGNFTVTSHNTNWKQTCFNIGGFLLLVFLSLVMRSSFE